MNNSWADQEARYAAHRFIERKNKDYVKTFTSNAIELANAFGFEFYYDFSHNQTDEMNQIMHALEGPYGEVIFEALKVKYGLKKQTA